MSHIKPATSPSPSPSPLPVPYLLADSDRRPCGQTKGRRRPVTLTALIRRAGPCSSGRCTFSQALCQWGWGGWRRAHMRGAVSMGTAAQAFWSRAHHTFAARRRPSFQRWSRQQHHHIYPPARQAASQSLRPSPAPHFLSIQRLVLSSDPLNCFTLAASFPGTGFFGTCQSDFFVLKCKWFPLCVKSASINPIYILRKARYTYTFKYIQKSVHSQYNECGLRCKLGDQGSKSAVFNMHDRSSMCVCVYT